MSTFIRLREKFNTEDKTRFRRVVMKFGSCKFQFWSIRHILALWQRVVLGSCFTITLAASTSEVATSAERLSDHSPIGNYLAGRHAQAEEDFDAAIEFLTAALNALPNMPDLLRRTFILLIIEGRLDEALPYAKRLLAENPREPIAHLVTLVEAFKNGSEEDRHAQLKAQPKNGLNGFSKPVFEAWSEVSSGGLDEALKALKFMDGNEAAQGLHDMHKALILDFFGQTTDAGKAYAKLSRNQEAQNFRFIQIHGNFLERVGKISQAYALYNEFSKANPGTMLLSPAYARLNAGSKPKPIISTPAEGAAEALFNLGQSLGEQRARETAVVFCRLALWLKPKFPIAQVTLADIFDGDQRYIKANEMYANIDLRSPFRFSADLRRASNLNSLKRVDAAIQLLEDMAQKFTSTPQPLIWL